MALYTIEAYETRVYLVEYMVEADSPEEALAVAEEGDIVASQTREQLDRVEEWELLPDTLALAQPAGVESSQDTPG